MHTFRSFRMLQEAVAGEHYSDEHAHARVWNHMVDKGIAHDKAAMHKEFAKAKNTKSHPLHFDNANHEGFVGGKKSAKAKDSYHEEHENAINTVHALANHKGFKEALKNKHHARVMGATKGDVSTLWHSHGATKGGTSKADIAIYDPKKKEHDGIRLSMKKGTGSQLMSGGPEENAATHDHATIEMLKHHPKYKNLPNTKKAEIHATVLKHMGTVTKHLNAMKTASRADLAKHRDAAQKALDAAHNAHPELNHYVRKEATTGEGKFGKGSPHAASYLVKSAHGSKHATVTHVDDHDYSGPRPRAALPKGDGRSGNVKADER